MDADRRSWASGTWDGAAEESLRAGLELTMIERLKWLQEIRRLSDHVEASRSRREEAADSRGER